MQGDSKIRRDNVKLDGELRKNAACMAERSMTRLFFECGDYAVNCN